MNNKPNTKCRICGKEYYCCADSRKIGSWRTIACCMEHYKEYMEQIEASRNVRGLNYEKNQLESKV